MIRCGIFCYKTLNIRGLDVGYGETSCEVWGEDIMCMLGQDLG